MLIGLLHQIWHRCSHSQGSVRRYAALQVGARGPCGVLYTEPLMGCSQARAVFRCLHVSHTHISYCLPPYHTILLEQQREKHRSHISDVFVCSCACCLALVVAELLAGSRTPLQ